MKLWLLDRLEWDYDQIVSCVVVAATEEEARQVAGKRIGFDELERDEFRDPERSSCTEFDLSKPAVVHYHRRHG